MSLAEAAAMMQAPAPGPVAHVRGVSIDTRTLQPGDLFFALSGGARDGHGYVDAALAAGAAGAVVERDLPPAVPYIKVPDTRRALRDLAAGWRARHTPALVGLTGSSGKTTVKELLAALLSRVAPTLATRGNFNNELGVPLTLLRLRAEHRFAVIEMGMNHAGEIGRLSRLARPDVALLLNAGPAHLEGLGSVAAVARAKAEIIEGLGSGGVVVLNGDDPHAPVWERAASGHRVLRFGLDAGADVTAGYRLDAEGADMEVRVGGATWATRLALIGRHNVMNALAAIAALVALEQPLEPALPALAELRPTAGRLAPRAGRGGVRVIDDSYNANPASVAAAIEVLAGLPGERVLVLGELAELGDDAAEWQARLGAQARAAGIEQLVALGGQARHAASAFGPGGSTFDDLEALVAALAASLRPGCTVLVKGSRVARMERVVEALAATTPSGDA